MIEVSRRVPLAREIGPGVISDNEWEANSQLRQFAAVDITRAWMRAFQDWEDKGGPSPSDRDLAMIAHEFFPDEVDDAGRMDLWAQKISTMRDIDTPFIIIAHFILGDVIYKGNTVYLVHPIVTGRYTSYYAEREGK